MTRSPCTAAHDSRRTLCADGGFTLVELLVALVVVGVLLAIAVPTYLGYQERASKRSAEANARAALPAIEAYHSDLDTYGAGDVTAALRAGFDETIGPGVTVVGAGATYTITSVIRNCTSTGTGPTFASGELTATCV